MWADLPLIVIRAIDEEDAENAEGAHEKHHTEPIVPIGNLLHSLSNLIVQPIARYLIPCKPSATNREVSGEE
jgi:hypothetical protein